MLNPPDHIERTLSILYHMGDEAHGRIVDYLNYHSVSKRAVYPKSVAAARVVDEIIVEAADRIRLPYLF